MINDDNKKDNIELHSEDVQDIMGRVPSWILRCGITIIGLVMLILFIGACLFSYPETISGHVVIRYQPQGSNAPVGYATMPPAGFGEVRTGCQGEDRHLSRQQVWMYYWKNLRHSHRAGPRWKLPHTDILSPWTLMSANGCKRLQVIG